MAEKELAAGWLQQGKEVRNVMLVRELARVMFIVRPSIDRESLS